MRQREHASRSTYRAILSVQAERDDVSGIRVTDRYFEPEKSAESHRIIWIATDILVISLIILGFFMLVATGFDIRAGVLFYTASLLVCACAVFLMCSKWHNRHRLLDFMVSLIAWLLALWVTQDRFINGARNFAVCMSVIVNRTYGGLGDGINTDMINYSDVQYFLFMVCVTAAYLLAFAVLKVRQLLLVYMIVLPLILVLALCGACDNAIGLFLVLGGVLLCQVHMGTLRQKRMWGGRRKKLFAENSKRYENIQKFSILASFAAGIILFIPGYFLVRPMLSFSLKPMETVSYKVQSSFLSCMVKILPDISAGKWNLQVESTGGGVDDGKLDSGEGYQIDNVDDLKVTIDAEPKENIFLRGFVGSSYKDGSWSDGYGSTFDAAAMNWNTDGSPRLYVQNLEFLRTAYAVSQAGSEDGNPAATSADLSDASYSDGSGTQNKTAIYTADMKVERINANDKYTYVPYGSYLNDYYTVDAGDGFINSQTEQEDEYLFYFRKDMENVLSDWNDGDNTDSVMDRVEESYRAYCEANYLDVSEFVGEVVYEQTSQESNESDSGIETSHTKKLNTDTSDITSIQELASLVYDTNSANRWKGQQNIDDITAWIRSYLDDNFEYSREYESIPDGEDDLQYFLFKSKKGDSVQFASAAVMLYRMFGIPARYVVGYEIPHGMFTAQPDGTWNVTCQGKNSQAWAEIYKAGIGWMPEDLTPGVMGSYDEAGPGGELVEESSTQGFNSDSEATDVREGSDNDKGSGNSFASANYSVRQIIYILLYAVAAAILIVVCIFAVRWIFISFGYTFAGRRSCKQRLIGEFQTFVRRMKKLGLPDDVDSQDEEFAEFCESILGERHSDMVHCVRLCIDRIYCICYAGVDSSEEDVVNMRKLVKAGFKVRRVRRSK